MRLLVCSGKCGIRLSILFFSLLVMMAVLALRGSGMSQDTMQAGLQRPLITQALDERALTTLRGNTHPMARPEFDLGTAPASLPMERMLLVLKRSPEQELALRKLLDDQQDKNSPNYHKWMTPQQYGAQFGPTDADMQAITSWLQSHGFQVGASKGRSVLEFSGSASQVQEAFHTAIHKYVVNGEQHWANASDPSIPVALAPAVAGISSLHSFEKKAMNEYVGQYSSKTKQLTKPQPNYTFSCGNGSECYGLAPYDFAAIYDVLPLWSAGTNGAGQTVAIVGRTDINPNDANTFWSLFGLSVPANKLVITVNGPDPGFTGDEGEANIDVQWSGAVAPQATVQYVTSASTATTDGVDLSALYIVDNNLAPVMSESYGQCELGLGTAGNQFYNALWAQAAAQGISVFVSSGDNGAAGCDDPSGPASFGLAVNGLASTPYNAAIGGTDFNQYNKWSTYWTTTNTSGTEQSAKGYIPETTWDDSCTNPLAITLGFGSTAEAACNNSQMISAGGVNSTGGSGGTSNCVTNTQGQVGSCTAGYVKPSWQSATGVPNDHLRDLPDVSLFASNGFLGSFYVICQQDQTGGVCDLNNFLGYGGTSVASPAFAGIMALVNQKTGSPQGVPGFALYKLVSKQANAFHDVPSGSTIAMPCWTGSPNCTTKTAGNTFGILSGYGTTTGYDLATGLGSVDAANLVNNWSKATFTTTTTTLQLNNGSAVSAVHGAAVPVSISLSPTAASGNAALLVSTGIGTTTGQAIDTFSLTSGTASGTTKLLPGGSYNVIAHYSGDGTYGGSYSGLVPVTISKENSTVALTGVTTSGGTVTTVSYDALYWVTLDVENSKGAQCSPVVVDEVACPTGTVTLTENGNPYGSGSYNLFQGHLDTSSGPMVALSGGSHTLMAQYSGDTSYSTGTKSVAISVTPANTTTFIQYFPSGTVGQSWSNGVTVNTTSYALAPSGTLTFYANGKALTGTTTYYPNDGSPGYASLSASFTSDPNAFPTPGTYAITAAYSGDKNYSSSSAPATNITVLYPTPNLTLTPFSQTVPYGGTATVTALVSGGNKKVHPGGTITFVDNGNGTTLSGPTTCTSTIDNNGYYACQASASFTVTDGSGVSANYSGDSNYPASFGFANIAMPDFYLNANPYQVTLTAGQSQNVAFSVGSMAGFAGTVTNFSCSGLPVETSCTFSPNQLTADPNQWVSSTLTISTTAIGQSRRGVRAAKSRTEWVWMAGVFLVGACLTGFSRPRKRSLLVGFIALTVVLTLPSCGGGNSGGGNTGGGNGGGTHNPVPTITSLSPSQLAAGSQSNGITVNGTNFMSTSTLTFGGIAGGAYESPTQMLISPTQNQLATLGQFPVVVTNPAPGGGASNSVDFVVTTGTPTGNFNITVTATSGALTRSIPLYLYVQ
jgi:subtilase family serine protease